MKKVSNILWGIILLLAGVVLALNALDIVDFDVFFDGWWTLFIIVPCAVGLVTEREKTGNLIGLAIGVALLLACLDVIEFDILWKLLVPAVIVIIGMKLILGGIFGNKANEMISEMKKSGNDPKVGFAAFSGTDMNFNGENFDGADITAVFGGVKCDLRGAVIEKDCAIKVSAIFGGVDILVPDNVNVKVNSTSVFGGASNKTASHEGAVTVYVSGVCMFGGVDIK